MTREIETSGVRPGGAGRAAPGQVAHALAVLQGRFETFRASHRSRTRIPEELRALVVWAVEQGVAPGEVMRVCRLSWSPVRSWKASEHLRSGSHGAGATEDVRVFSVVNESGAYLGEPATSREGQELELRLGSWSVSVRLAGPAGRGRACSR